MCEGHPVFVAGRYGFARVAPLLADVAAVEEGGSVSVTATPEKMELPSESMRVRVEPLRSALMSLIT